MVYVTGDTHGHEFEKIEDLCIEWETTLDDVVIILGDAGINFYGDPTDANLKRQLNELPITILCIHGNHEIRPESIRSYDETDRFGGVVYQESEFPNLLFAKDGEIYELDGFCCMAIGGAYSIDKYNRKEGVDWWANEQPSEEIMERVETRLGKENWQVDVIFSHTCPFDFMPRENFFSVPKKAEDYTTEKWLQSIEDKLDYSYWFCGHFHTDKFSGRMRFLYHEIVELDG